MRYLLAILTALGGCGVLAPQRTPGVACIQIWEDAPDFAPGIVDFRRPGEYGVWVLLATGGPFAFSAEEDSTAWNDPRCI